MQIASCRQCQAPVDAEWPRCPNCGAIQPALAEIEPKGYEWASKGQWMGLPLVHIAFGYDSKGNSKTACGIVAIGQRAIGGVAIGIVAGGFVSIGLVSVGVFSLGAMSIGAIIALGFNAFGAVAIGVVAAGYKVGGVATFGSKVMFSAMK